MQSLLAKSSCRRGALQASGTNQGLNNCGVSVGYAFGLPTARSDHHHSGHLLLRQVGAEFCLGDEDAADLRLTSVPTHVAALGDLVDVIFERVAGARRFAVVFHIVLPDRRPPAPKLKATVGVRGATCREGPISDIVGRPQLIGDDRAFPIAQIRIFSSLDDLLSLPRPACDQTDRQPALN